MLISPQVRIQFLIILVVVLVLLTKLPYLNLLLSWPTMTFIGLLALSLLFKFPFRFFVILSMALFCVSSLFLMIKENFLAKGTGNLAFSILFLTWIRGFLEYIAHRDG